MKKKRNWIIGIVGFVVCAILFFPLEGVLGEAFDPGSQNDPLVSKSYVDRRINEILSIVQGKPTTSNPDISLNNEELLEQVDLLIQFRLKESGITSNQESDTVTEVQEHTYEVVEAKKGQKIIGEQGTEIILRSGKAVAIASELGGLQDITAGSDVRQGKSIPQYHLILIPRADGRGFEMTADGWLMIRGKYEVK